MATDSDVLARYATYQRRRNLSPNTIYARRRRLLLLAEWLHPAGLLTATTEQIEGWLDSRPISPQTRYGYIGVVSAFYRWAHRERIIDHEPSGNLVRPKLRRAVPRPISEEDLAVALELADDRMRCWLLLASFCGLRVGEMVELRVEDIHRDRDVILVHGKGDRERLVPLHPAVLDALVRFGLPRAGYVFRNVHGGPMRPATVSGYIGRFLHSIGSDATAHRGRHRYGTMTYRLSSDLRMTQELLGHQSPTTTAQYVAWFPAEAAEVVNRLPLPSV